MDAIYLLKNFLERTVLAWEKWPSIIKSATCSPVQPQFTLLIPHKSGVSGTGHYWQVRNLPCHLVLLCPSLWNALFPMETQVKSYLSFKLQRIRCLLPMKALPHSLKPNNSRPFCPVLESSRHLHYSIYHMVFQLYFWQACFPYQACSLRSGIVLCVLMFLMDNIVPSMEHRIQHFLYLFTFYVLFYPNGIISNN